MLFNSIEEATRWAEWELERIAGGQAGWTADVSKGHWEHAQKTGSSLWTSNGSRPWVRPPALRPRPERRNNPHGAPDDASQLEILAARSEPTDRVAVMSPRFSLDALPELVSRVREAVVHVDCRAGDGGVSGAGFAIPVAAADKAPGIVVTNAHVVAGDRPSIRVHSTGQEDQRVKVRLIDQSTDLALLELPEPPSAVLTPRHDVRVGEAVIAIGSPLGYEASVTLGIVSALGRLGWGTDYVPFDGAIQTDAAITHGNSGGPLIGVDGCVVGVNYSGVDEVHGINFAIPIGLAVEHYREICDTGERRIRRASLGVRTDTSRFDARSAQRLECASGARVLAAPRAGSPAHTAGLRTGDVIVRLDDEDVRGSAALIRVLNRHRIGKPTTIAFVRRGKLKRAVATPTERQA